MSQSRSTSPISAPAEPARCRRGRSTSPWPISRSSSVDRRLGDPASSPETSDGGAPRRAAAAGCDHRAAPSWCSGSSSTLGRSGWARWIVLGRVESSSSTKCSCGAEALPSRRAALEMSSTHLAGRGRRRRRCPGRRASTAPLTRVDHEVRRRRRASAKVGAAARPGARPPHRGVLLAAPVAPRSRVPIVTSWPSSASLGRPTRVGRRGPVPEHSDLRVTRVARGTG